MSRTMQRVVSACALVLCVCWGVQAQVMPLPSAQQGFEYPPTADPVTAADPAVARPIGVGPVAEGGDTVRLRIGLPAFSGPVDLYVGIMAPAIDPFHLYIVNPNGQLVVFETQLIAWKTAVTQPVDEFLFGDIPISALPPGQYHCYLLASPAGSLSSYYLWHTFFVVRNSLGGCGDYSGSRSFSITYNHLYTVDYGCYHQDLWFSGSVPFTVHEDNTITGNGTVTYGTHYFTTCEVMISCSGLTTVDVTLGGRLTFNEYCQAMLEVLFTETVHPMIISCVPYGGGFIPESSNKYTLTFPVIDGAIVSGPPYGPGVGGTANYILHVGH